MKKNIINITICVLILAMSLTAITLADIESFGTSTVAERILGIKTFVNGFIVKDPNTASINSTGDARVHSLGVNCVADPNNYSIVADPNQNKTFCFGKGKIYGDSGNAYFSHYDCGNTSDYAIGQSAGGWTFLNAKAGQVIGFYIGNSGPTLDISNLGLTMSAGKTITIDGLTIQAKSGTLADDATITLPTGVCGILKVWSEAEHGEFFIKADGTIEYIRMTTNVDDVATDGYLCVVDAGSGGSIINKLGSEKKIRYTFEYSTE